MELVTELRARQADTRRYAAIHCPVLLMWGREDEVLPPAGQLQLAEQLPDVRTCPIDDCGHTPHEERAQVVVTELRSFLHRRLLKP